MDKSEERIRCFNEICQASNPQNEEFCYTCGLPLVKRYLWAVNKSDIIFNPGQLIEERYLCKESNIFLDTTPGTPPETTENLPRSIQPYLKLSNIPIHIPQVFGRLLEDEDIWLLEYGTIPLNANGELKYPQELLPSIGELWPQASTLQQVNWLIQLTRLWEPLKSQGVLSTLLQEDLLKINGNFIQLRQLHSDELEIYTLKDLSRLWGKWLQRTSPPIKQFLEDICEKLEKGEIELPEELLPRLEQALKKCQNIYDWLYSVYVRTDTGPSREQNEDSCYPADGTLVTSKTKTEILTIICDGIGGQEAGEVASQLAINSLTQAISSSLAQQEEPNIYQTIKKAIYRTNDLICERNDQENRSERQRMGTTLVMGLTRNSEVYITNVGDSRAYWITKNSCHRITVDDDIASRAVRLGSYLYRDAIEHVNAGALTQALGTASSNNLYPSIQRHIPDQDCLILLTSDGLSDFDRIEQYWKKELLPLLEGEKELTEVGENLIRLANDQNGHDNTTIALICCQVKAKTNSQDVTISFEENNSSSPILAKNLDTRLAGEEATRSLKTTTKPANNIVLIGGIISAIVALSVAGFLGYKASLNSKPTPTATPTATSSSSPTP